MITNWPSVLAYLDPGSGSIMLQVVLGAIAASGVALTVFWQRLRGTCRRLLGRKDQSPQDPQA